MDYLAMIGSHPQFGGQYLLKVPFVKTDAGRSMSKRPRQTNDCTVRALALATGANYDVTYDAIAAAGRKVSRGFDFRTWAKDGEFWSHRFQWTACPAVKGRLRETPVTFALGNPSGRFILRCSKHVLAVIDGAVYDQTQHQGPMGLENRCVYGYWRAISWLEARP